MNTETKIAICLAILLILLWRHFRPITVGVVGFEWDRVKPVFKQAAREASSAVGRRVRVVPKNVGVAVIVPPGFPAPKHDKPVIRLELEDQLLNDTKAAKAAICRGVAEAELLKRGVFPA